MEKEIYETQYQHLAELRAVIDFIFQNLIRMPPMILNAFPKSNYLFILKFK